MSLMVISAHSIRGILENLIILFDSTYEKFRYARFLFFEKMVMYFSKHEVTPLPLIDQPNQGCF